MQLAWGWPPFPSSKGHENGGGGNVIAEQNLVSQPPAPQAEMESKVDHAGLSHSTTAQ